MSQKVYCICRKPEDDRRMIECCQCKEWFHLECVKVTDEQASRMEDEEIDYFCPICLVEQTREPGDTTSNTLCDKTAEKTGQLVDNEQPDKSKGDQERVKETLRQEKEIQPQPSTSGLSKKNQSKSSSGIIIPTVESDDDLSDNEYIVKEVVDMRKKRGSIQYRIRWQESGSQDSWLDERDCQSCIAKVNLFRVKKKKLNPLPVPVGASSCQQGPNYNHENWITIEQAMLDIKIYDRKTYSKSITIMPFEGQLGQNDCIFLFPLGQHCFTGLFLAKKRVLYLSDGGNVYIKSESAKKSLKRFIGRPVDIIPIPFNEQKAIDHCGTSASLLAIEYKRIYQRLEIPDEIKVQKWLQETLIAKEHKSDSKPQGNWMPINERQFNYCCKCGKEFRERNKNRFICHQLKCKGNT